ncbi:MAG: CPBP family intramembrane metalloprotease, partial [Coriobacteriales bacterium]|nr:CPBP family intramembrane metalloprotease [Coriobacteriales bacterium]
MRLTLSEPRMVAEARQQSRSHPLIVEILIWIAVFIVAGLVIEGTLQMIVLLPQILTSDAFRELMQTAVASGTAEISYDKIAQLTMDTLTINGPYTMLWMLFSTLGLIAGVLIYVRAIERRRFTTMGFRRGHALREYLLGLLVGAVVFSASIGICVATGSMTYEGFVLGSLGLLALFFVGFMVQGLSEELLCRGYFMVSLARRQRLWVAVIISSLFFAALHLGNNGIFDTPFTLLNLTLFGVFAGIYILKRGNIWGAAAIHSVWNFVQGNLYGLPVSGGGRMETVFAFTPVREGVAPLINGGAFGPEGGLAVTAVLLVGCVILLLMKTNPAEKVET